MNPFGNGGSEYLDAVYVANSSDKSTSHVTTSVAWATRDEELDILQTIFDYPKNTKLKPFYDGNRGRLDHHWDDYYQHVLTETNERFVICAHEMESGDKEDKVNAIQSALLLDLVLERLSSPLVVVNGGPEQTIPLLNALSELRDSLPDVVHCQKAESYYPVMLLACLASYYVVPHVKSGGEITCTEVHDFEQTETGRWAAATEGVFSNSVEYSPAQVRTGYGNGETERICCWYDGRFAVDDGSPVVQTDRDKIAELITMCDSRNYNRLANFLRYSDL